MVILTKCKWMNEKSILDETKRSVINFKKEHCGRFLSDGNRRDAILKIESNKN